MIYIKKILITILTTCLLFSSYTSQIGLANEKTKNTNISSTLPTSRLCLYRQTIESRDEGSHYRNNSTHQEWWYYIAFFNRDDSELKNWSMMVSFNQMGVIDILFCTIYEENNISYGGSTSKWKGAMNASGPYVNVEFENSYVTGKYPEWHIYAEHKRKITKNNVTVNITYKAKSKPVWLFMNTGHNNSKSKFGHYCIINNEVNGTVKINETVYYVHGVGYHEHSWINDEKNHRPKLSFLPKKPKNKEEGTADWQLILNIWDFGSIFLDNGWNIFVAKMCQQSILSRIMPGELWITADGKNIAECHYFKFEYLETNKTSIPSIEIPTKIHIKAIFLNTWIKKPLKGMLRLDLYIEVTNLHEFTWHGSNQSSGVWEAPCKVHGNLKWLRNNIELKGLAMLEITRTAKTETG